MFDEIMELMDGVAAMAAKPGRMTALLTIQPTGKGSLRGAVVRISPGWGGHDLLAVTYAVEPLQSTEGGVPVPLEMQGKFISRIVPVHEVVEDGDGGMVMSTCPFGNLVDKMTSSLADEPMSLAGVLAEYDIELVGSEEDMLAEEGGLEA